MRPSDYPLNTQNTSRVFCLGDRERPTISRRGPRSFSTPWAHDDARGPFAAGLGLLLSM